MCYLCDDYGDPEVGNGIWYLNPRNYGRNMYKLRRPGQGFKGAEAGPETGDQGLLTLADLVDAQERSMEEYERLRKKLDDDYRQKGMDGQVLPLKEAERVIDLCSPIGAIGCNCKKLYRCIEQRNEKEYTCMGMGVGMLKWERWPERYKGGVKFLNQQEAKDWLRDMDKKGYVHSLMLFGAPYIGGFCQCYYPECGLTRQALDFGVILIKGHNIYEVDRDICNGCGICSKRCQFGAIKFEATLNKAFIDPFLCYGCGLCETGCKRNAIKAIERKSLPALAEAWK